MLRVVPGLGTCLIADRDYAAGEVVTTAGGPILPHPTVYTIQLDAATHVEVEGPLRYTAHSCEPNTRVEWDTVTGAALCAAAAAAAAAASGGSTTSSGLQADATLVRLVALRPIPAEGIVSFDYCTSEWDMAAPFDCSCGAAKCRRSIGGFKPLARDDPVAAAGLIPATTPFVAAAAAATFPDLKA